jgi:3-phosphoshikimate 1-carboxyvinyltransferase
MQDNILINPGRIFGEIKAYPSKSYIQRALALGLLNTQGVEIRNYRECADSVSVLNSVRGLGAKVTHGGSNIEIFGTDNFKHAEINCGESGLCLRMFIPILSLSEKEYKLKCADSLMSRGNEYIPGVLRLLGVSCTITKHNISVKGPIKSGEIQIDNPSGSQLITGLMFALSKAEGRSRIKIKNPVSFPYIRMTSDILNRFGAKIELIGENEIIIKGNCRFKKGVIDIEGDWSSSAFFLVGGTICGEVTISGLNCHSLQPDAAILKYLRDAGALPLIQNGCITLKRSVLKGFDADIKDHPDLFIPLVVLAMNCEGVSRIYNYERLKYKESDRPAAIISELKKAGAKISVNGDHIRIEKSELQYSELNTFNDHRLAMGFAIAALNSVSGLKINDTLCVKKSYPDFFSELRSIITEIKS